MGGAQVAMGAGVGSQETEILVLELMRSLTPPRSLVLWFGAMGPSESFFPSFCTVRTMLQLGSSCHVAACMEHVMQWSTWIEGVKSSTNYQSCASLPVLSLSDIF